MVGLVFADTVEDDHVIVDCVTDDGKDCGYESLVHVEGERKYSAEEREESDHDYCSVGKGSHATQTPSPVLEPDCDVGEDYEEGDDYGYDSVAFHIVRNGRTHLVGTYDTVRIVHRRCEFCQGNICLEEAFECCVENIFNFCINF